MAERTLKERAREAEAACHRFETDLGAFVDGEKTALDGELIAAHLTGCDGCRAYVEALAGLSRLHLFGAAETGNGLPSGTELWGDLTRRLLDDNCGRLAATLYELGKALVARGLTANPELRGVRLFAKKPGSISRLSHKGQALFREHSGLADTPGAAGRDTVAAKKGLFASTDEAEPDAAFEAGRACLEQCLRLQPDHHAARIYLAKYFNMTGRCDRARQLLRTVLHSKADPQMKFFALQQMARVYSMARQFDRAVELEREVLAHAERDRNDAYQAAALTNISIYTVKLGRLDEAEQAIDRLATQFPEHLETLTAPAFRRARDFRQILLRHRGFLARLRGRYPLLFAS
jgi:tetratricopeptide (TPR) repeat protein